VWEAWKSSRPDWRIDWDRAVGALTIDCAEPRTETRRRWVEFLLHLSSHGVQGDWEARFATPVTLAFRGGLLRDLRGISVSTRGDRTPQVEIHSDSPQFFEPRPNLIWRRQRISVLSLADVARPGGEVADDNAVDEIFPARVWADRWNNLTSAIGVLESFVPHYAGWVRRVFRAVIPLISPRGVTMSSSDATAPGVIRMSLDHDPITIGELLIHESAHLYFHLLEHGGPVINGADPALYWSPFRRAERPIRNLLLAYHAFVNVVLYYRSLEGVREANRVAIRAVSETIEQHLAQIDGPLECSHGLTPRGRFVWSALHQELNAP
jgi:HEXXH motif-containing protein